MKIFSLISLFIAINSSIAFSQASDSIKFDFGTKTLGKGTPISSKVSYNLNKGYGFDFNTNKEIIFEKNAFTSNCSTYFSIALPEGNYTVKIKLGSDQIPSNTTIKAESRRLMRKNVPVIKGASKTEIFTINLRGIEISTEAEIKLKNREKDDLNWDQKLTLEFSGAVAVRSILIKPAKDLTKVFLAGDSTVTDQDLEPWASWGQMITQFFSPSIVVSNYAASGASLGSFKGRKRLKKIITQMDQGDYLFIEFGHNDEKIKGEGNGADGLYTELLIDYICSAREKGGIPILLTPTQRRQFSEEGKLKPTHGNFPDAMRKVAKKLHVPLIDLTTITSNMYESWGIESSKKAFVHYPAKTFPGQEKALADNTHFNSFGANEIALAIIAELRILDVGLKKHLRKHTPGYDPSKPNNFSEWKVPISPRFEINKPEGN